MPQEFPPIHLYALLAAAVAVMNMSMGRQAHAPGHGWLKRWSPFLPVVLTVLHIGVSILQKLLGSPQIDWHLAIHGVVLTVVVMIGGGIYADHLSKIATERNTTLPPLESESG